MKRKVCVCIHVVLSQLLVVICYDSPTKLASTEPDRISLPYASLGLRIEICVTTEKTCLMGSELTPSMS